MDYHRFLAREEQHVLPYLGGPSVGSPGRSLRVVGSPAFTPGWWRFRVRGRQAEPLAPAEPDEEALAPLPRLRGHLLGAALIDEQARPHAVAFLPADEPAALAPAVARRWAAGELLFETLELESDAEEAARRALEERGSLADLRGAPASLRAAFAYALGAAVGRELRLTASPLELRPHARAIAEEGAPAATAALRALAARRASARARAAPRTRAPRPAAAPRAREASTDRVEAALSAAGARLLRLRALDGGRQLEVTYQFLGARFQTLVAADGLQVLDAGVCLDGEDRRVTLASLPGVIREAVTTGQLVVTRRV